MSSLLTNNSAMVALQTLKTINKSLGMVQDQISTGKRIANARDNAALWGISTTMKTDVTGFKAISESLSLGSATLSVARDGAETITSLLDQLKGKIVAAQEENVDRVKIQADVKALRDQISTVVAGAQFNGLNLLSGSDEVNILASLNRDSTGLVTESKITFNQVDLTQTAGVFNTGGTDNNATAITAFSASPIDGSKAQAGLINLNSAETGNAAGNFTFQITDGTNTYAVSAAYASAATQTAIATSIADAVNTNLSLRDLGITAAVDANNDVAFTSTNEFTQFTIQNVLDGAGTIAITAFAGNEATLERGAEFFELKGRVVNAGDGYRITLDGTRTYDYVAREGDTINTVAAGLLARLQADTVNKDMSFKVDYADNPELGTDKVTFFVDNPTGASTTAVLSSRTNGTVGGGLENLALIDVSMDGGPAAALGVMEGMIQRAISAAASFGSAQGRIQTQSEFVSKLADSLTSGIGALVDADMEEASARLQALQVQQQLGIQALTIANQQPQNILALFNR